MMQNGNVKMALAAICGARWRSLLTMAGVIIGVLSVITIVSIGEGVKHQLTGQITQFKSNVLTVEPGGQDAPTASTVLDNGGLNTTNLSSLSSGDVQLAQTIKHVEQVVPLGVSGGFATVDGQRLPGSVVMATGPGLPAVLDQQVEFGAFFTTDDATAPAVVIGQDVANQLFNEQSPIGRTLQIRGQDFTVRGVFADFAQGFLPIGVNLNKAVYIPYLTAANLSGGAVPVSQMFVQVDKAANATSTAAELQGKLAQAHGGQTDFTILKSNQAVQSGASNVRLLTEMISGVAAISLLVGGLGIINIMLVSVSERTREIGIRKAIGATNRQILSQFTIEAAILSFLGGLIGVGLALLTVFIIRLATNLHPILSIPVVLLTPVLAWLLGIIFGLVPAVKAARKDPIESLRYE